MQACVLNIFFCEFFIDLVIVFVICLIIVFFSVFDASAKFISAGWFDGSTYNLGNFDECVDVEVFEGDDYIQGQYCLVEIEINPMADSKYRSREHDFNESSWDTLQASQTLNSSPHFLLRTN